MTNETVSCANSEGNGADSSNAVMNEHRVKAEVNLEDEDSCVELINTSFKKFGIGESSDKSSLYIVVNYKELEKAETEEAMFKSVKYCGITYSMTLEDRMSRHKSEKKKWKDYKMLEVETSYINTLEYGAHCLSIYLPNLESKPGAGAQANWAAGQARRLLKAETHILSEIKEKIVKALRGKNYVNDIFKCDHCFLQFATKSTLIPHRGEGSCKRDKQYFKLFGKVYAAEHKRLNIEEAKKERGKDMVISFEGFKLVVQGMLKEYKTPVKKNGRPGKTKNIVETTARKISVKDMIIILLQCVEKESKKNYLIEINDERLNPDTIIEKIHNGSLVVTDGDQIITIGKTTEIDFDITPEL